MDLKAKFQTNKDLEKSGVWIDIGDGAELLIARRGNPNYLKVIRSRLQRAEARFRTKSIPDEESERIMAETTAETILLGWRGVKLDGVEVPYSRDTAVQVLIELPDFRVIVDELSQDMELFKKERDKEIEKN